ncbi:MATE efflux family protein [Peptostreptococcus stomatis DSM 17678]|uniref:Multidrug export protein MepA n=1 Tax=Peptostreptococcus stomatis DSM 17678 TaxID=596315 RepID=E0E1X7_9FIRM|nr:MATE family efflux transporter [Peptostreptococcus stomatis]EFM65098.1 MATE efflux family protein [Peptostreptococcus stomatis DSM 17678]
MSKDLGNDKISKLLLDMSIPAILSMLVAAIYNIVDRIFIGRINPLGLTAIGITMPFQVVQMAFILLIGVGGSTLISIKYGEKKYDSAEKILYNSLVLIIISELIISLVCIIFMDPIFDLMGVSKDVYGYAKDYIWIILIGGVPGLTGYCLNNSVRSLGHAKESMIIVMVSSILNIILDALFIFVFKWGVKGAAIATVISQTMVTVFVLYFFIKAEDIPIKFRKKNASFDLKAVWEIFQNGLPNFYMNLFGTIVSIILNRFIIDFGGDYHLASVTIISSVSLFITMIIYGISQGAQPLIGYNFGANKYHRIVETVKLTTGVIVAISSLFLIFIEFYPKLFVYPYTSDTRLLDITGHNIRIYLLGITFVGIHSIATTYFQSIRRPKISSLLYILRYGGILIPFLYIVPKIMGINGVYLSNALSDTISGVVALIFLYIDIRRLSKRQGLLEDI